MDLRESNRPNFQPCFFIPYQGHLNTEPYDEDVERVGWKWEPLDDRDEPLRDAEDVRHYLYDYILTQGYELERSWDLITVACLVSYALLP